MSSGLTVQRDAKVLAYSLVVGIELEIQDQDSDREGARSGRLTHTSPDIPGSC